MTDRPISPLVLSLGDPAGIGPELIAALWAHRAELALPPFALVGGAGIVAAAACARGIVLPIAEIASPADARAAFADALPVLCGPELDGAYTPGEPDAQGARIALASLDRACVLCLSGAAAGVVTMPVAKAQLAAIGFAHPGQTEFVAAACGKPARDAVMMLAGPSLRAVPITVHCALGDVPRLLTTDLILHKARIVDRALRADFGIDAPRLAIAGLNPHAGENGRMGSEEQHIIAPAIAALRDEGIAVTGPVPGDALFTPRARSTYDVALAMYHDQALIPLKALEFDEGVNVTLGLPIVRTSPDHGTAFDIAGKGLADPGASVAALRMAAGMAQRRGMGAG